MPTSNEDLNRRVRDLESKVFLGNGTDSLLVRTSNLEKRMSDVVEGQQSLLLQSYALDKTLQTFIAVTNEKAKQSEIERRKTSQWHYWLRKALIGGLIAALVGLVDHASFSWHIH